MKISLRDYGTELAFWLEAFKPFVAKDSASALAKIHEQLEDGRDNLRASFPWKLANPIMTIVADRYDGKNRTPHRVRIGWQFETVFDKGAASKKHAMWTVQKMVTQIRVHSADDNSVASHFHFDMKNGQQLGPHIHLQISEDYQKDKGRIPLAVPRYPIAPLLPTDCLDLVLNEFFPFAWPESQVKSRGSATLRNRQRERLMRISQAVVKRWDESLNTPIVASQGWYAPDLVIA